MDYFTDKILAAIIGTVIGLMIIALVALIFFV